MQFKFNQTELLYVGGMLRTLAANPDINRPMRRNVNRLAGKFVPWAKTTHLKTQDVQLISYMLNTGLDFMRMQEAKLSEEKPENYIDYLTRATESRAVITTALMKLHEPR